MDDREGYDRMMRESGDRIGSYAFGPIGRQHRYEPILPPLPEPDDFDDVLEAMAKDARLYFPKNITKGGK